MERRWLFILRCSLVVGRLLRRLSPALAFAFNDWVLRQLPRELLILEMNAKRDDA